MPDYDLTRRFGGLQRLYGARINQDLATSTVMVAGIGGVGSWAVEALARSGVGHLILVDLDHIAESNINRQVHALSSTLGQAKVQAMADRLLQINPELDIRTIDDFIEPDNAQRLITQQPLDFVLDCTDQAEAKIAMLQVCRQTRIKCLMCGGAGGKTNPLAIQLSDMAAVQNDALLAKIRQRLRRQYGYARGADKQGKALKRPPKMGVPCIWLNQKALQPDWQQAPQGQSVQGAPQGLSCAGYGSIVTVTASMGLAAAAYVIEQLQIK
ncbi:tRNA threonylcarbamoyladenosine dehydratase [Brackiella oedipodis]|uniref:tRNA threonylcarbamoyladenosine dehydratase n=1 Tax=Brackiella oedipodis TaxID=124225 RepID=UPI00049038D4|nr:tRNA threonylcarbamoyladenosine dehydratase [Brackiella oedipodis]